MKSYLSLVPISARVHRRQSRMTRICIVLAVFLVTSIFSMAEMFTKAQTTEMRRNHGDWHIALQHIPEEKAEQIRADSRVAVFSWYDEINTHGDQGCYVNGKTAALYGMEKTYITEIRKYPTEGVNPQNEQEVALSAEAKELFGIGAGDRITVTTPAGDFDYIVSGFYEDDPVFNRMIDGICVYMNRPAFDEVRSINGIEPASRYYIRFQNERGLKKIIAGIEQQYGLSSDNVDENMAVLSLLGASTNESMSGLYPLAAGCFVIILFSGVFMISSCMNSNVAQRTKFFGMMRCIGASKQQIMRFVRLEALNWCKTAIPIGCLSGMVTCWILSAILKLLVKGEWVDMPLFSVSISGILSGAVVGVITVFIAAHSPAKQAARVSPVAAISGNAEVSKKVVHAANTMLFKVETSLGIHHAVDTKKNLLLMTGSFALTIMLFFAFSGCLDVVHKLLPSVSNFSPDITIISQDETNSIDGSIIKGISEVPEVKSAFGMRMRTACPVEMNGQAGTIDLFSYSDVMMDRFRKSVISGDYSKVYGNSGYAFAVYDQGSWLDAGDKIIIGDEEIEIACVVAEGVGSVSGAAVVVCSEETFARLTGEQGYAMIGTILDKNASETAVNKIYALADACVIQDSREEKYTVYSSYWVFRLAAYGFLAIITLITVLNIMNSISMGVSARIKQYGAMRAVGMENRQVTRMITAEAVTYAVCGMIVGTLLGLWLHHLIYVKLIISHFGGFWKIPVSTIAIIFMMVFCSCVVSVYAPAKRMRNMSITETINDLQMISHFPAPVRPIGAGILWFTGLTCLLQFAGNVVQ